MALCLCLKGLVATETMVELIAFQFPNTGTRRSIRLVGLWSRQHQRYERERFVEIPVL